MSLRRIQDILLYRVPNRSALTSGKVNFAFFTLKYVLCAHIIGRY